MRVLGAGLVLALLLPLAQAGDGSLAGNWKISIYDDSPATFWILHLENKKGEWTGSTTALKRFPPAKVSNLKVTEDVISYRLTMEISQGGAVRKMNFDFEGKLPKGGGKKILGSFDQNGVVIPVVLESTSAKTGFDLDREMVARNPNDPRVFSAVFDLISQAKANKSSAGDVRDWVETALAASDNFGPRWKNDLALKLFDQLVAADGYAAIAAEIGQKIDKSLDAKAPENVRMRLWDGLALSLRRAGKLEQALAIESKLDGLITKGYEDYSKKEQFPVDPFKGRKGKSKRAVLVELFTGAQCPPCVAADLGFDALGKAFKPSEVVRLQYHLHIPGPDALTNEAAEARQEFYGNTIKGTPVILFNGKPGAPGGGSREDGEEKFKEYRNLIERLLEKETDIDLTVSAVRKGDKIQIQAQVKNLDSPGKEMRLRLALVEDWVRYQARNGLYYHQRVVRDFPGGPNGLALTKKDNEKFVTVDLDDLRKKINKYLDNFQEKEEPFPDSQRPLRMRDLHVVGFVQNDDSGEVLQAVDVAVKKGDE